MAAKQRVARNYRRSKRLILEVWAGVLSIKVAAGSKTTPRGLCIGAGTARAWLKERRVPGGSPRNLGPGTTSRNPVLWPSLPIPSNVPGKMRKVKARESQEGSGDCGSTQCHPRRQHPPNCQEHWLLAVPSGRQAEAALKRTVGSCPSASPQSSIATKQDGPGLQERTVLDSSVSAKLSVQPLRWILVG